MTISHYKKLVITFRRVSEVFYKVCALVKYWGTPLWKRSGVKPCDKKGFSAFQRTTFALKTRNYTLFDSFFSSKIKLNTVKSVVNSYSKRRPKLHFQDRLLLIAGQKSYKGSILRYFGPSLSYPLSIILDLCLFLSDRLRQVLL